MIRRGLLCAALLLASPALPAPAQAAAQSDETHNPPNAGSAQPSAQPEPSSAEPSSSLRIECTPASRAATLIGKHGCVAGKVFSIVTTHRGRIRLYLCPHNQCSFHATVYEESAANVGNLSYLRGKIVVLVGDVTEFHGAPEMIIEDKEQIKVASGGTPQEFDAAQPRAIKRGRREKRERAW